MPIPASPQPARRPERRLPARALALPLVVAPMLATQLTGTAQATVVPEPVVHSADGAALELTPLGSYDSGVFDASAAEIVAHHAGTDRLFVVNAQEGVVDVLDAADVAAPVHIGVLDTEIAPGAVANSVAVRPDGLGVVAVEAADKVSDGRLVFFDARSLQVLGSVTVGAQPDMVTVTPDGRRAVVANEGEPAADYSVDPEGSVSVVDLPRTVAAPDEDAVAHADLRDVELPDGVRVFGPEVPLEGEAGYLAAQNLEPEYVAVDARSRTAYVTLQENNALAVVDLASATVTEVRALGTKDHSLAGNGLDVSDRDDAVDIAPRPVQGLYMPDAVAAFTTRGEEYLVTANEGDAREWDEGEVTWVDAQRAGDLGEDGTPALCAATEAGLAASGDLAALGRLEVSVSSGLSADGSCVEELHSFGARSFSVWSTDGDLVFDSGDDLEQITAEALASVTADGGSGFNSNHSATETDSRSDAKGPEPEAVAVGEVRGRTYAFVGLERVGGVMVYDVTVPAESFFVTYVNNRNFSVSVEDAYEQGDAAGEQALADAGDLGPEGLVFVSATDSPTGGPLLVAGNEVSGTTTVYAVGEVAGERTGWAEGRPGTAR
ncbi:choice-of-anchor I family protein [Georgenia sp. M64]|uniref:choice-of-anchor I family protein n=1 Tax=Georgenia sp. M64 TaxID=3120520 RepID=UPI0030E47654